MTLLSTLFGMGAVAQRRSRAWSTRALQITAAAFMVLGIPSLVAAKNLPPTVEFQEPTPGQRVPFEAPLTMVVSTYDPDGYTHMAEFFADGKSLGAQVLDFLIPPAPGEVQQYQATWVASDPGVHVLSVVVMDDQGTTSGAEVRVQVDGDGVGNQSPQLSLLEPKSGGIFEAGSTIAIVAEATDPDGYIPHVEYFVDAEKIGEQTLQFLIPPKPGQTQSFKWAWNNARAGQHLVTVLVTDDQGGVAKASSLIVVGRDLPVIPLVSIEATGPQTGEPCPVCRIPPGRITLRREGDVSGPLTVYLKVGGTATPGLDYQELPTRVEFPASQASVELIIAAMDDPLVESDEEVVVSLLAPELGNVGFYRVNPEASIATVTIHSEDALDPAVPTVGFKVVRPETREPFLCLEEPCPKMPQAAPATVLVFRQGGDLAAALTVPLILDGTARNGVDYAELKGEVTIPAGKEAVEVDVIALPDGVVEGDESVTLMIPIPPGLPNVPPPYFVLGGQAKVVIHDASGDQTPIVRIEATQPATSEPCPTCLVLPGVFSVIRSSAVDADLTVMISYTGTAEFGIDYAKLPSFVTIPAGSDRTELKVLAQLDKALEPVETVVARVEEDPSDSAIPHYRVDPAGATAEVTIQDARDNPLIPVVSVRVSREETTECPPGLACKIAPIDIIFTRSGGSVELPLNVLVQWGGTATFNEDYSLSSGELLPVLVQFQPGSLEAHLYLSAMNDCVIEGEETVALELIGDPSAGPIPRYEIDQNRAAAKMVVQDASQSPTTPLPIVHLRGDLTVLESCPPTADCVAPVISIRRKGSLDQSLEVALSYGGTAKAGADFTALPNSVVIPAGLESVDLPIQILNDSEVEEAETLVVSVVCSDAAVPGYAILGEAQHAVLTILDDDINKPTEPLVRILSPVDGAMLRHSAGVNFVADAVDPNGVITRLDWFQGEKLLGSSELIFKTPPPPGTVLRHDLFVAQLDPGDYEVRAVGVSSSGVAVKSGFVRFRVSANGLPVVTLKATTPETYEVPPWSKRPIIPAVVTVRRDGDVSAPLPVFYKLGGSAANGVDYERLDGDASFAPGEAERVLYISPITDFALEGDETVEVRLIPRDAFELGQASAATITIHDGQTTADPTVTWITPSSGAEFAASSDIPLEVQTIDPTGYFGVVEFLANGEVIGSESLILCAGLGCEPNAGQPIPFRHVWKNPKPGTYVLTAVAINAAGNRAESEPIKVTVTSGTPVSSASRFLPASYFPGQPVPVEISVKPVRDVANYAIVEHPPKGWIVSGISEGGVWDPATQGIKFGPFFDAEPRFLKYSVVPNADARGQVSFEGTLSVDGTSTRIAGDQVVSSESNQHPADIKASDWSLTADEITAYGAAWKKGSGWSTEPSSIPIDFVTRAAALWQAGEGYRYDPSAGAPPLCWVSQSPGGLHPLPIDMAMPPKDLSDLLQQLRESQSFVSTEMIASNALTICRIRMVPGKGVRAQAAELKFQTIPTVSSVSDGGHFDPALGTVRWGPFLDGESRVLEVVLEGSVTTTALTTGSFDGNRLHGAAFADAAAGQGGAESATPRIAEVRRLIDGSVQLFVVDALAAGCELMFTEDLKTWHSMGKVATGVDCQVHSDAAAGGSAFRFYRVVRSP